MTCVHTLLRQLAVIEGYEKSSTYSSRKLTGKEGRTISRACVGEDEDISEERKVYVDNYVRLRFGNKPRYIVSYTSRQHPSFLLG